MAKRIDRIEAERLQEPITSFVHVSLRSNLTERAP
jgi:hypothetical protein